MSEEEERVERRVVDGKLDDAPNGAAAAALAHLFGRGACLVAAPSEQELTAGREAETTGCCLLEAERGAEEAEAPPAAAVIEQRIIVG